MDKFDKWWRSIDGDNYPFDKKRLCFQLWEIKKAENKKLMEAVKYVIDQGGVLLEGEVNDILLPLIKDGE